MKAETRGKFSDLTSCDVAASFVGQLAILTRGKTSELGGAQRSYILSLKVDREIVYYDYEHVLVKVHDLNLSV